MVELLLIIIFLWLFWQALRLVFKITWGAVKILAVILFVLALPSLIGCLLFAETIALLLPVAMVAGAWGLLRLCV